MPKKEVINNPCIAIVGERYSGKTYYIKNTIIKQYAAKGSPIIVFQDIDNIDYKPYIKIAPNQLKSYFNELAHKNTDSAFLNPFFCPLVPFTDELKKSSLDIIYKHANRSMQTTGLIVIDDFSKWENDTGKTDMALKRTIAQLRHCNIDIYLQGHLIEKIPKGVKGAINYLFQFATQDTKEGIANRFGNKSRITDLLWNNCQKLNDLKEQGKKYQYIITEIS